MAAVDARQLYPDFGKFKKYTFEQRSVSDDVSRKIMKYRPTELYAIAEDLAIS